MFRKALTEDEVEALLEEFRQQARRAIAKGNRAQLKSHYTRAASDLMRNPEAALALRQALINAMRAPLANIRRDTFDDL